MSQRHGILNTFCMRYCANMEMFFAFLRSRQHFSIMILIKSAVSTSFLAAVTASNDLLTVVIKLRFERRSRADGKTAVLLMIMWWSCVKLILFRLILILYSALCLNSLMTCFIFFTFYFPSFAAESLMIISEWSNEGKINKPLGNRRSLSALMDFFNLCNDS